MNFWALPVWIGHFAVLFRCISHPLHIGESIKLGYSCELRYELLCLSILCLYWLCYLLLVFCLILKIMYPEWFDVRFTSLHILANSSAFSIRQSTSVLDTPDHIKETVLHYILLTDIALFETIVTIWILVYLDYVP